MGERGDREGVYLITVSRSLTIFAVGDGYFVNCFPKRVAVILCHRIGILSD